MGGGVKKKRIALNAGNAAAPAQWYFLKKITICFFYDGWLKDGSKKAAKEIGEDELEIYKKLARAYFKADKNMPDRLKANGTFREVKQ